MWNLRPLATSAALSVLGCAASGQAPAPMDLPIGEPVEVHLPADPPLRIRVTGIAVDAPGDVYLSATARGALRMSALDDAVLPTGQPQEGRAPLLVLRRERCVAIDGHGDGAAMVRLCARYVADADRCPELVERLDALRAEVQRHLDRREPWQATDLAERETSQLLAAVAGIVDLRVADALARLAEVQVGARCYRLAGDCLAAARPIGSHALPPHHPLLTLWMQRQASCWRHCPHRHDDALALIDGARAAWSILGDAAAAHASQLEMGLLRMNRGEWAAAREELTACLGSTGAPPHVARQSEIVRNVAVCDAAVGDQQGAAATLIEFQRQHPPTASADHGSHQASLAWRAATGRVTDAEPERAPPADSVGRTIRLPAATTAAPLGLLTIDVPPPETAGTWSIAVGAACADGQMELLLADDRDRRVARAAEIFPSLWVELPAEVGARIGARAEFALWPIAARLHVVSLPEPPAARPVTDRLRDALGGKVSSRTVEALLDALPTPLPPSLAVAGLLDAVRERLPGPRPTALTLKVRRLHVDLLARLLPVDHPLLCAAHMGMNQDAKALGDLASAVPCGESFLAGVLANVPLGSRYLLRVYYQQVRDGSRLGDDDALREAVRRLQRALSQAPPPQYLDSVVRESLGFLLHSRGEPLEALRMHAENLRILEVEDAGPQLRIAAMTNLAKCSADLGDERTALLLLQRAERLLADCPAGSRQDLRASIDRRRALLTDAERGVELAEATLQRATAAQVADAQQILDAKAEVAVRRLSAGRFEAALALQQEILPQLLAADSALDRGIARGNLAAMLAGSGDHPAARDEYALALRSVARVLPADHPGLAVGRRYAAWNLFALGRDAATELVEVLEPLLAGSLARLSRERHSADPRRLELVAAATAADVATALALAHAVPGERRPDVLAATFSLRETARSLSSDYFDLRRQLLATPGDAASRALDRMRSIAADLAALRSADDGLVNTLRVLAIERRQEEFAQELHAIPGAEALWLPIDAAAIARSLAADEAAVAYTRWRHEPLPVDPGAPAIERYAAFVVTEATGLHFVDLGPADPIDRAIADWRSSGDRASEFARNGAVLHDLVLAPIRAAVPTQRRLWVVPDDALHLIAFDVLATAAAGPPIECLRTISLRHLDRDDEPALPEAPHLLAFGGIDYAGSHRASPPTGRAPTAVEPASPTRLPLEEPRDFASLPHTATEVEQIAALFRSRFGAAATVELAVAGNATKAGLTRRAAGCDFLHLATHGYALGFHDPGTRPGDLRRAWHADNALVGLSPASLCGLAFAGANDLPASEGLLTAAELAWIDLSHCRLAVLSGCDTTLGLRTAGRTLASLQAALHAAGVRTSIAALWAVDDGATREFMQSFYGHLWREGLSANEALRRTRVELAARRRPDGQPRWSPRDYAGWVAVRS